ncbi:hypothetical protein FHS21_001315 [Phyllobacterium trifolii]|uniref:Uncharacterized protein n=1 Tax=Phyllobacterium trifolii TaxID=300193 RepID=A0A839U4D8_9HYPH|nr:hypothetical protein [Phyllobacterium trifolii]MBB3144914.1 hypothetical protein [Phyllobacterium trifolii]
MTEEKKHWYLSRPRTHEYEVEITPRCDNVDQVLLAFLEGQAVPQGSRIHTILPTKDNENLIVVYEREVSKP